MVFISTSTMQFLSWEGLISLTTFLYSHKLTWNVDVQKCKKLHLTVWQKLITVAKGKAEIEMSPFSCLRHTDALNALNGFDEYVGRLQRRLPFYKFPL